MQYYVYMFIDCKFVKGHNSDPSSHPPLYTGGVLRGDGHALPS